MNCAPPDGGAPVRDVTPAMLERPVPSRALRVAATAAMLALAVSACSETVTVHGYQFQETDVQRVSKGMGQEQVRAALGSPTTTASVGTGSAYYYITSVEGQTSFFKPVEKDRKVLAVYFSPMGSVERVAQYGLKDGKVFDFASQTTPTGGKEFAYLSGVLRSFSPKI
jgi:outer membrane protein assembly factor BamE (lipoprotein component of BamABCDE complex)